MAIGSGLRQAVSALLVGAASLAIGCGGPGSAPEVQFPDERRALAALEAGNIPPLGSQTLSVQPEAGRSPVINAIRGARKRVEVIVYMLTDDEIIAELVAASRRGVAVRVLLDGSPFGGPSGKKKKEAKPSKPGSKKPAPAPAPADPFDKYGANAKAFRAFNGSRVQVKPTAEGYNFTHAKMMLVDDKAIVLTANMTNAAFTRNREYIVTVTDAMQVDGLRKVYEADWTQKGGLLGITRNYPYLVFSPDNARFKLSWLIGIAKQNIMIQMEFIKDPQILELLRKKTQQGVKVQVLIAAPPGKAKALTNTNDKPDPAVDVEDEDAVQMHDLEESIAALQFEPSPMLEAGGGASNVKVDTRVISSPYLHSKMVLVDDRLAYVGSINMTANSMDNNREIGLLVWDRALLQTLKQVAVTDWNNGEPSEKAARAFGLHI